MEEIKRGFTGIWIPREVWFNTSLNALDRLVFGGINVLADDGKCFASDEQIANFCRCSKNKVAISILNLEKNACLHVSFIDKQRILSILL